MSKKSWIKKLRLAVKILAVAIFLFALPFYFGYGNPLPFADANYTLFDNIWLSIFPLVFVGLIVGLKYEKAGGYLISVPILLGSFLGAVILREGLPGPMFIPLSIGFSYLFLGYKHKEKKKAKGKKK
jgi:hypothetical protein